jgi:cytochrome c-type biogenesis protein CcmH
MIRWLAATLACALALSVTWAVDAEPPLDDPVLQQRYEDLVREVRCLVCQNQTIADSTAPLAADLRREIRQMISNGASDVEVNEFLVARYGDFVLYRPPIKPTTWALWAAPAVLLVIGGLVFATILLRKSRQRTDEEGRA